MDFAQLRGSEHAQGDGAGAGAGAGQANTGSTYINIILLFALLAVVYRMYCALVLAYACSSLSAIKCGRYCMLNVYCLLQFSCGCCACCARYKRARAQRVELGLLDMYLHLFVHLGFVLARKVPAECALEFCVLA